MADLGHLELLQHGVASWNAWRNAHPTIRPHLAWCSLRGAGLMRVNLRGAVLFRVDLSGATLDGANLEGATYTQEQLRRASSYLKIKL
jgi:uncharacterized protein YjbI with pentapeptide repeats